MQLDIVPDHGLSSSEDAGLRPWNEPGEIPGKRNLEAGKVPLHCVVMRT